MTALTRLPATDGLADDEYHVYALTYAKSSARRTAEAFAFGGADLHDAPLPIDYNVWIVQNARRRFLIESGSAWTPPPGAVASL